MLAQRAQNICITFAQRRANVFDVGPTLYKCYTNVLCLQGCPHVASTIVKRPHYLWETVSLYQKCGKTLQGIRVVFWKEKPYKTIMVMEEIDREWLHVRNSSIWSSNETLLSVKLHWQQNIIHS